MSTVASTVKLHRLDDQVHEFTVSIRGNRGELTAHWTFAARVRVVWSSPAVWLNELCIAGLETEAELEPDGSYRIRL